jgi:hypothetical protein
MRNSPGRLGVCVATSGPGGIHLLNGLYDAKMDGVSVLAMTGLQHSDMIGTLTQQDVVLDKLFIEVAVYNERDEYCVLNILGSRFGGRTGLRRESVSIEGCRSLNE